MENPLRKKARKTKSRASNSATQSNENILDPSTYLTYDILRIVFQYLNARDLANAARTCRSWLEAANNEKFARGPYFIKWLVKPLYSSNQRNFLNHLKNLTIKPSVGFCSIPSLDGRSYRNGKYMEECIETLLSKHCETIMSYSGFVTMCKAFAHYPNVVCTYAFLPQIPNVSIKSFKLKPLHSIRKTAVYREVIRTIVNHKSMRSHEMSTCFLIFCNEWTYEKGSHWQSVIRESMGNEIVSVCSLLSHIKFISRTNVSNSSNYKMRNRIKYESRFVSYGILITGSIQIWSTVFPKEDCITEERIEAKLKLFKDEMKLKKHSVAFIFICSNRRTVHHLTTIEAEILEIFERLFPKVPYINFSVEKNEFEKPTTVSEVNKEKNIKNECEFSILFLILTYG